MVARYDYLVVGSGLAGLTFALHAARHGTVCVLTKAGLTESNTSWAQGGIAAAVGELDSWELHERDTLIAGAGLCDPAAVRFLVQQAPEAIEWLISLGANFDTTTGDDLALGREGGHSRHRIVHHQDRTGWEVERAVAEAVTAEPNISIWEHAFVTELHVADGRCIGCTAEINDLGTRTVLARATVLATGGCGKVYAHTTNPRIATGDGIGLASKVGAEIQGMEFMQFHPTTLYHEQAKGFLITEAVRGDGATLRNHHGQRFMYEYDERLELAPRDVVSRSIAREMARLLTWCVYLDATHLKKEAILNHFPTIYEKLTTIGIRMEKDWIPIVPAQHYSCGGIRTNLKGQTSVPGLYASGETASTGVHGGNRLASNSLLEAMVFSKAAAEACQGEPAYEGPDPVPTEVHCPQESDAIRIRHGLQRVMSENAGVFRSTKGLKHALEVIHKLKSELERSPKAPFSVYGCEAENLLIAGEHVVQGALARKENVGIHFNVDLDSGQGKAQPLADQT